MNTTHAQPVLSTERKAPPTPIARRRDDLRQVRRSTSSKTNGAHSLARALGWFSVGLGLAELLLPRKLGRAIGVGSDHTALLPLMGLREIAAGAGVLVARDPTLGIHARVAGDMIDLALLGRALASSNGQRGRVVAATAAVVGVTALDALCAAQLSAQTEPAVVSSTVSINRSAEELYKFFRNFENLPRVFKHVSDVHASSDNRSHWTVEGPAGARLEWDAEITQESPSERMSWRALPGSGVVAEGRLVLKPLPEGRGTQATLELQYGSRGAGASMISKLFGAGFQDRLTTDLRRWKQLMETGEIPTTEGQSSGKRSIISRHLP